MEETYTRLIALLNQHGAQYRLIDHAPEGRTEQVLAMRGNRLSQAAKCIILMVKPGKKVTRDVLAVVPADAKVDVQAVKALMQGTCVAFASAEIAERLAGSVTGTILPFSFNPALALMQWIGIRRVLVGVLLLVGLAAALTTVMQTLWQPI